MEDSTRPDVFQPVCSEKCGRSRAEHPRQAAGCVDGGFYLTRTTLMTRQTSLAVPGGRVAKHRVSVLVCFYSLGKWTASGGDPDLLCRPDAPRRIGTRRGRGAVAAPGEEAGGLMRGAAADGWLASLRDLCWVAAFSPLLARRFLADIYGL